MDNFIFEMFLHNLKIQIESGASREKVIADIDDFCESWFEEDDNESTDNAIGINNGD